MTEEKKKDIPYNMRLLAEGRQDKLMGMGFAVQMAGNARKGRVVDISADSTGTVQTVKLCDSKWYDVYMADHMTGDMGRYSAARLFPTRRAALESRDSIYKAKPKPKRPDSRVAGAAGRPESEAAPRLSDEELQKRSIWPMELVGKLSPDQLSILKEIWSTACPIRSLLENDLYKFSMAQFVLHRYPRCYVRVEFKNRNTDEPLGYLAPIIDKWLNTLCKLKFTEDEIIWLRLNIPWLSSDFIDYLQRFYMFRQQIEVSVDSKGELVIVAEGPWRDVIWFEVPVLAMVAEARARFKFMQLSEDEQKKALQQREERLTAKIRTLNYLRKAHPFTLSEFGLRRRSSAYWEDIAVERFANDGGRFFTGTSNVYLAKKFGLRPSGTMAHELFMGMQGVGINLRDVQREVWRQWMDEYRGKNGIMLTDPFGAMQCMKDLDWYTATSFGGFRHDSGCPFAWGELFLDRLKELEVKHSDEKTFVWSNNLNLNDICDITPRFSHRVQVGYGWGTGIVHDLAPVIPANIVMKVTRSNNQDVLKLPDAEGKQQCRNNELIEYTKRVYDWKPLPTYGKDGQAI